MVQRCHTYAILFEVYTFNLLPFIYMSLYTADKIEVLRRRCGLGVSAKEGDLKSKAKIAGRFGFPISCFR